MSLQSAIAAGYKPNGGAGATCAACAHARASKVATTMKVCRRHELTVHPQGVRAQFSKARP